MSISRAADMYYTYRFLKTLVTDWKDTDAFAEGIIDEDGKNLIKFKDLKTNDQKDAYTTFHRLVFNIKRILEKVPFGRSKLASYAAALFLLREETGMSEEGILSALEEMGYTFVADDSLSVLEEQTIAGWYILNTDIDESHVKGSVVVLEDVDPVGSFGNTLVYRTLDGNLVTANNLI
jgi:hypothetical protein